MTTYLGSIQQLPSTVVTNTSLEGIFELISQLPNYNLPSSPTRKQTSYIVTFSSLYFT